MRKARLAHYTLAHQPARDGYRLALFGRGGNIGGVSGNVEARLFERIGARRDELVEFVKSYRFERVDVLFDFRGGVYFFCHVFTRRQRIIS